MELKEIYRIAIQIGIPAAATAYSNISGKSLKEATVEVKEMFSYLKRGNK